MAFQRELDLVLSRYPTNSVKIKDQLTSSRSISSPLYLLLQSSMLPLFFSSLLFYNHNNKQMSTIDWMRVRSIAEAKYTWDVQGRKYLSSFPLDLRIILRYPYRQIRIESLPYCNTLHSPSLFSFIHLLCHHSIQIGSILLHKRMGHVRIEHKTIRSNEKSTRYCPIWFRQLFHLTSIIISHPSTTKDQRPTFILINRWRQSVSVSTLIVSDLKRSKIILKIKDQWLYLGPTGADWVLASEPRRGTAPPGPRMIPVENEWREVERGGEGRERIQWVVYFNYLLL